MTTSNFVCLLIILFLAVSCHCHTAVAEARVADTTKDACQSFFWSDGQAVSKCPDGKTARSEGSEATPLSGTFCIPCSQGCRTCARGKPDICTSCSSGLLLSSSDKCEVSCLEKELVDDFEATAALFPDPENMTVGEKMLYDAGESASYQFTGQPPACNLWGRPKPIENGFLRLLNSASCRWEKLCPSTVDAATAQVMCTAMGLGQLKRVKVVTFPGDAPVSQHANLQFNCTGTETSPWQCRHNQLGACGVNGHIKIHCKGPVPGRHCVQHCRPGSFPNNSTRRCQKCDMNCATCTDKAHNCSSCPPGRLLSPAAGRRPSQFHCLKHCPLGSYPDGNSRKCVSCQQSMASNRSCGKICPAGLYKIVDYDLVLVADHAESRIFNGMVLQVRSPETDGKLWYVSSGVDQRIAEVACRAMGLPHHNVKFRSVPNLIPSHEPTASLNAACSGHERSLHLCPGKGRGTRVVRHSGDLQKYAIVIHCSRKWIRPKLTRIPEQPCIRKCPNGFHRSKSYCFRCPLSCMACHSDAHSLRCTQCPQGSILHFSRCVASCPAGFSAVRHPSLGVRCVRSACSQGCLSYVCTSGKSDTCRACQCLTELLEHLHPERISMLDSLACIPTAVPCPCPAGRFTDKKTGICQSCPGNCVNCQNASSCMGCETGFGLLPNNKCGRLEVLPAVARGFDSSTSEIVPCHFSCRNCSGAGADQCLSCNKQHVLENGKCLPHCSHGYVHVRHGKCQPCPENCISCSKRWPHSCLKCSSSRYLFNGSCVAKCPEKTLQLSHTATVNKSYLQPEQAICGTDLSTKLAEQLCLAVGKGPPANINMSISTSELTTKWSVRVYCPIHSSHRKQIPNSCSIDFRKTRHLLDCATTDLSCGRPVGGVCVASCGGGFVASGEPLQCQPCGYACKTCRRENPSLCLSCFDGMYLQRGGVCVQRCPVGQYGEANSGTCRNVTGPCVAASKLNGTVCTACPLGAPVNDNGVCKTSCRRGLQCLQDIVQQYTPQILATNDPYCANRGDYFTAVTLCRSAGLYMRAVDYMMYTRPQRKTIAQSMYCKGNENLLSDCSSSVKSAAECSGTYRVLCEDIVTSKSSSYRDTCVRVRGNQLFSGSLRRRRDQSPSSLPEMCDFLACHQFSGCGKSISSDNTTMAFCWPCPNGHIGDGATCASDEDAKDWQITVNVHHSPVLTGTNFRATCTIKPTKRNQAPWFDLRHPAAQWYSEKCYSAIPGNCIGKVGGTRTKISARPFIHRGENGRATWSNVLHIPDIQESNSGEFTCRADFLLGSLSKTIKIKVEKRPVQLTIMRNESQSPSAGLVLRCLATGDKSAVVYWIRPPTATDSHILLANTKSWRSDTEAVTEALLVISPVTYSDCGVYTCVSKLAGGRMLNETYSVYLNDLDSASVHPLSHEANFSAPLFGRAQTTLPLSASVLHKTRTHGYHFQWFTREGKPLISNGRIRLLHSNTTIVICSVFSADYGIYHVVVSNNTGSPIFTIRISLNNIAGSVPDKRVGEEDRLWIVAVVLAVLIVLVVIGVILLKRRSVKKATCKIMACFSAGSPTIERCQAAGSIPLTSVDITDDRGLVTIEEVCGENPFSAPDQSNDAQ